jgi:hypothetical protein
MNTRFAIFLVSIAAALIAYMAIRNSWMAAGVIVGIVILSAIIEPAVEAALKRTTRSIQDRVRELKKGKWRPPDLLYFQLAIFHARGRSRLPASCWGTLALAEKSKTEVFKGRRMSIEWLGLSKLIPAGSSAAKSIYDRVIGKSPRLA